MISETSLYQFDIETEEIVARDDKGILFVSYIDAESGEQKHGTVCTPEFDYPAADLLCSKLGYKYGEWGTDPQNIVYTPR